MLDRDHIVRAAPGKVAGVLALGVQGLRGDDRVGDFQAVQQLSEHRDLIGLGPHLHLAQHHAPGLVERREQVTAALVVVPRAAQSLAVHRDHPPLRGPGRGTPGRPLAGQVIEGVRVQALQGPPDGGLARHRTGHPEPGQRLLVSVGGPLGDRGERPRPGQHRAHRQP
jgi:hypothetical protein